MAIANKKKCSECFEAQLGSACMKGLCKIISGMRAGKIAQKVFNTPDTSFSWFSLQQCEKFGFEDFKGNTIQYMVLLLY